MDDITLVLAQFGNRAAVIEPSYSSFLKVFGNKVKTVLYTDVDIDMPKTIEARRVYPPYLSNSERYGNRCNDLYKIVGLLEAQTQYAVALDSDMKVVSNDALTIKPILERFGLCIPANPRMMVKVDNTIGADSDGKFDETKGCCYVSNMSPIGFYPDNTEARELLNNYVGEMTRNPVRGPIAMWRAIWKSKINPYLLPPQWCVCLENVGIGNEIILHMGHEKVRKYYDSTL